MYVSIYRSNDFIQEVYENKTISIMAGSKTVATINKSVNINLDLINEIRSNSQKKDILEKISRSIGATEAIDSECPHEISFFIFLNTFEKSKEDLESASNETKEDYEKTLNALFYLYDNIWYSTRNSRSDWFFECLNNVSDQELDIILALTIIEDLNFVKKMIGIMPNVEIVDEKMFDIRAKSTSEEMALDEEDLEAKISNYLTFDQIMLLKF